ncbi:LacI family DNA-binding transcriptional regulator [Bifidobacterium indicum]|uniref:LacI family DNA-binding transcriptional regulator n=1 Tax=Bifidobacterium indicum TaxID=1691 RepID=UPI0030D86A1A
MQKRVTIKDVAKEADVSIKTVSNVLNHSGSMRPDTRKRVKDAMVKLGYQINMSARSLKTGATGILGLGIFDFTQPFGAYLADKVIETAREQQYGVVVSTYSSGGPGITSIIDETYHLATDGWIFFVERPLKDKGLLLSQTYPIVMTGDYRPYGKADFVTMPNTEAERFTTGRLLDAGCRRLALVGAPAKYSRRKIFSAVEGTQELRVKGYVQAFEERGLEVDPSMIVGLPRLMSDDGMKAADYLLDVHPDVDGIICLNDAVAYGVMHQIQKRGRSVPDDVQVVGFDNTPEGAYANPSLTTVDPLIDDYARMAVSMLIERINGYSGPVRTYTTGFELVERDSTRLEDH